MRFDATTATRQLHLPVNGSGKSHFTGGGFATTGGGGSAVVVETAGTGGFPTGGLAAGGFETAVPASGLSV